MHRMVLRLILCLGVSGQCTATPSSIDQLLGFNTQNNTYITLPSTPNSANRPFERDAPEEKARLFALMEEKVSNKRSAIKSVICCDQKPCFVIIQNFDDITAKNHSSLFFKEVGRSTGNKKVEIFFPTVPLIDLESQKELTKIYFPLPAGNTYKIILKHITLSDDDLAKIKAFIRNPKDSNGHLNCLSSEDQWVITKLSLTDPTTFYDRARISHYVMLFKAELKDHFLDLIFGYKRKKFLLRSTELLTFPLKDKHLLERLASLTDVSKVIDDYWEKDKYDLVKIQLQRKAK